MGNIGEKVPGDRPVPFELWRNDQYLFLPNSTLRFLRWISSVSLYGGPSSGQSCL